MQMHCEAQFDVQEKRSVRQFLCVMSFYCQFHGLPWSKSVFTTADIPEQGWRVHTCTCHPVQTSPSPPAGLVTVRHALHTSDAGSTTLNFSLMQLPALTPGEKAVSLPGSDELTIVVLTNCGRVVKLSIRQLPRVGAPLALLARITAGYAPPSRIDPLVTTRIATGCPHIDYHGAHPIRVCRNSVQLQEPLFRWSRTLLMLDSPQPTIELPRFFYTW